MDANKIVVSVVSIAIACLFAVTLLIPVISESTKATDTFENEGSFEMTYSSMDDVTLVWDHTKPSILTVNDVDVTMPTLTNGQQRTILCGDNWLVRFGYGSDLGGNYVQWYPSIGSNILVSQNNGLDISIVCESGVITVTDTAVTPHTATGSYTYLYSVSANGDYVMKNSDAVYMNGDTEFYAMGLTNVGTFTSTGIKITGTIDDGATWSIFRGTDYTFADETMTFEEVDGYEDLYKLTSMSATVTKEDQSVTAVYSYFIVPAEIVAEKSIHPDDSTTALLNIIPLFVVMGIILGAVGLIAYRRF